MTKATPNMFDRWDFSNWTPEELGKWDAGLDWYDSNQPFGTMEEAAARKLRKYPNRKERNFVARYTRAYVERAPDAAAAYKTAQAKVAR